MDFIRRNINKTNRNGTVYVGKVSNISTGNIDISNLQGDFLPATTTDKITYTVPHYVNFTETVDNVTKNILQITSEGIKINGNVIATGEVSAFGAGESSSSGGNVTVYDGLDSTSTDIALSANQGRILKGLIDNIDVGDIDLTGYYSKSEIDNKLSAKSDSTHTHTFASITSKPTTLSGYGITDVYTKEEVDKLDKNNWNYITSYVYDETNGCRFYWIKMATMDKTKQELKVIEIVPLDDSNYACGVTYRLFLSNYEGSCSFSLTQEGTRVSDSYLQACMDSNGSVWIRLENAAWVTHNLRWKEILSHHYYGTGSITLDGTTKQETEPENIGDIISHSGGYRGNSSGGFNNVYTPKLYGTLSGLASKATADASGNTITSTYATKTELSTHTSNSTAHITSTERTNWNTVYSNWNKVFTIDSNGNLKVKVNVIGEKEISAYGAGSSTSGGGSITIVDALTSTATDAALSANQGRVLKGLIDNLDLSQYVTDLSNYYTKTQTDNLLSGKSDTSHKHSQYYDSEVSRTANTVLAAPNGSAGTATFRKLVAADIPTLAISKISELQTALDEKATSSHTHNYLSLTGGTITGSVGNPLAINTTAGRLPYIAFQNNGTNGGFIGGNASGSMFIQAGSGSDEQYNVFKVNADGSLETSVNGTYYDVITDLNASSKTVGNATKFNGYTMRASNTWVDKSIDARVQYTINASALSSSNFYPIIFSATPKDLYVCMYSQQGQASAAYNQNKLEFTFRGQGWNDTPTSLTVHNYNCYTSGEMTIGRIGMGQEAGHKVVWVRGGLTYYIISNITPSLKTANFTSGNEVYTVGTGLSGGTNTKVTTYWTPQTTSGLGAMYHSGSLVLGASLAVASNVSVNGTSTFTGLATFDGNLTAPASTTNNSVSGSYQFRNSYGASLSSAGWYRFATSATANNSGGTYIFFIRRSYYNSNNESYIVSCTVDYNNVHWCILNGHANTRLITQIRCTYTNNSTMYFDLYYSGTVLNEVYVNAIGNCTLQKPTATTSTLNATSTLSLADGIKLGTMSAYPITVFRNAANGGAYIQYGANNQLTKSWAAGSDTSHNFAFYYKDTSAGTDICKMKLTSAGVLSSDYWMLNNTVTNPYLKLTHTYNNTTYTHYLQGYQGYLYLGAGSSKSLRIDSSGNCLAVGEVTAHSDKRLKSNIKPLSVRGELNPVTYTKDGKESIGFIADEVKEFYPELVVTDDSTDEKYLSLNYAQLTAVLYAEIKELKKEINELKNKIQ